MEELNIKENKLEIKKRKYIPTSFAIIFILMLIFVVVSWIGVLTNSETTVWIKKGSKYMPTNKKIIGTGILDTLVAVWHGFQSKAGIILFVLSIGAMLGVATKTKAIDAGLERVIIKLDGKEIWMIPILMFLFGLGGTTFGMWEETIVFFPILIPIFIKAGYGPIAAIFTILLGCGFGNMASAINPFSVGVATKAANSIAQTRGMAGISPGLMMGIRWIIFIILFVVTSSFTVWSAIRYKKGHSLSGGINVEKIKNKFEKESGLEFTLRRKITVTLFSFAFLIMILAYLPWGNWLSESSLKSFNGFWNKNLFWIASSYSDSSTIQNAWSSWGDWGFISMAGIFLLITLLIFAVNHKDFVDVPTKEEELDDHWEAQNKERIFLATYMNGAKDVLPVCLIIAFAAGLGFILELSHIGPWIANSLKNIGNLGIFGFGIILFIIFVILGMLIPSSSGFATAFIPIFSLIGLTAFGNNPNVLGLIITIYVLALGITNLIAPTNAALVAYTEYCGLNYFQWIQQIWKLIVIYFIGSIVIIILIGLLVNSGNVF